MTDSIPNKKKREYGKNKTCVECGLKFKYLTAYNSHKVRCMRIRRISK